MRTRRHQRGFSLLETMLAGAVMLVGLVGVTQLLTRSAANTRDGTMAINAAVLASQGAQEFQASGYSGLSGLQQVAGDAGVVSDYAGRKFYRSVTIGPSDGGSVTTALEVDISVAWTDSNGQQHTNYATALVSPGADGG